VDDATYFEKLVGSVTRVVRHSYYPGKEETIELCLEELEDLRVGGRITAEQLATLRELLTGEESSCLMEGVLREREHPSEVSSGDRIAIVCQGIGSQAAFTAGVLQGLLGDPGTGGEIVALAGTSCGALCSLAAWDGLLRGDRARAVDQLAGLWNDYSANSPVDAFLNYSTQMLLHFRAFVTMGGLGACALPPPGREAWRRMLERRIDFAEDRALAGREGAPGFVVGSMDLNGKVELLSGPEITAEAVVAATVVVPGVGPVGLESHAHPDESRLPITPIGALMEFQPTELWIIQIQRTGHDGTLIARRAPAEPEDVVGNLLLERELQFLSTINRLLERGALMDSRYRQIDVHRIVMEHDLDDASKFDRSPGFIDRMMNYGRDRAAQFLEKRRNGCAARSPAHLVLG
jgi:NTE family protein